VAIKVLRSKPFDSALDQEERLCRFAREAAAGRLSHPGIVTVFHFGQDGGLRYLVMELVAGESLERLLALGAEVLHPRDLLV
jgi:serine/threonine-protein kinase